MRPIRPCLVLAFVLGSVPILSAEPFHYPVGKHGKGELRYINEIPVLTVAGTPTEIGEQIGTLAVKPIKPIIDQMADDLIRGRVGDVGRSLLSNLARGVYKKFPDEYREEIEAIARTGGIDPELLRIGNVIVDLEPAVRGCSDLAVEAKRSATGEPLLGRNADTPPIGRLADLGIVIVYRPDGKIPFAMMTFPGALQGGSGINAAGLAFGANSVYAAADGSPAVNPDGLPTLVAGRRLLDSCKTVDEVERGLRATPCMIRGILPVCDRTTASVMEITSKTIVRRKPSENLVYCTNHFRADGLRAEGSCRRYEALTGAETRDQLGVADVKRLLHDANQRASTLHSMVFEPATLTMHVAFGDGKRSATDGPWRELDLKELLKP